MKSRSSKEKLSDRDTLALSRAMKSLKAQGATPDLLGLSEQQRKALVKKKKKSVIAARQLPLTK